MKREKEKMKKIQQILWRYMCHLYLKLMNYNEVRSQYTLLQYNDIVVKVHVYVYRPVAIYGRNYLIFKIIFIATDWNF